MKSLYDRGLDHLEARDYDEAEATLKEYLTKNPTNAMAYNKLGVALAKRLNRNEAKQCFKEALNHDARHVHALNNLGNIAREEGDLEQAVAYYQKAIRIDPDYSIPHNNLSVVYKQLHRYGDFIREIKTAKRLENKKALNPKEQTFMSWLKELWSKRRK
ncbi:tetratricopeptide repeat protein [Desulfosporosinus shakirovi]|uniref:tetratricopeptide repeat protein n=1 Tax=Desulfosporosinus shakirovi TaxID=2885154 RepID=UPI001E2F89CE|nr:tetratricopeptide repeat protein [Desulfosporosinus sp. SRJS8]MCB8816831.1 tetratricopeptide repeat protein [Desulfosporosinus sp. SRJS8]